MIVGREQRTGFFTQSLLVFILKPFCALREVARAPLKRVRTVRSGAFEARVEFGVRARPEGAARPEAQCCHRGSLHKSYSKFPRTTYITSVNHIYEVCRIYMIFIQLSPRTPSRVAPRMTTQPVPTTLGDPPGMNHGASPRTISKRSIIQHDPVKLAARQRYCRYRRLQ
jgi:hypothetical protein